MNLNEQAKEIKMKIMFSNLKKEQMSLRPYRIKESLSYYSKTDMWGFPKSYEYRVVVSWRNNLYTKTAKIKKSSILYTIFQKQEFSERELALSETFAQWLGTYVGQSFIQYKLKLKGYKEYGETNIPCRRYLLPEGYKTGADWDLMDSMADFFNSNSPKAKKFLRANWMGLYENIKYN